MQNGDETVRKYTWFFDGVRVTELEVSEEEKRAAVERVPEKLQEAIRTAYRNIEAFHRLQLPERRELTNGRGVWCWQEARAIERVGLYVPGGSAPLFSTVLMLGIPARLAGCRETVLCTPPDKEGEVNPAILWTAELCGISRVFRLGGIQAVMAMSLGTESVPRVDKLFGPGNRFVTAAKQYVARYGMAVDLPAGPSEVMVVADGGCPAAFVAADLLSQAEHGPDSQAILLCRDANFAEQVEQETRRQMEALPRKAVVEEALRTTTEADEDTREYEMMYEEICRRVHEAIDALPEGCRKIFREHLAGKKNEEIAALFRLSVDTVKNQKKNALRILRGKLGDVSYLMVMIAFQL